MSDIKNGSSPRFGMSLWLLSGGTLVDRVDWAVRNGFNAISLLQGIMDADRSEREEAAASIREAGLAVTYHGNVHHRLRPDHTVDEDFVRRMADDVLWWHHHAGRVLSCCSDAIHTEASGAGREFVPEESIRLIRLLAGPLGAEGIRVGIENCFGGEAAFRSLDDMNAFMDSCGVPNAGLLLDGAHANIHLRSGGVAGEDNMGSYVRGIRAEILEVHLSDNHGEKDEHRGLGEGNLDLGELVSALRARKFSGVFTIEVCRDILSGKYGSDIHDPDQTAPLIKSLEAIRAAWAGSRRP